MVLFSQKVAVIINKNKEILASSYIWTEGAPVNAAKRLLGLLEEQFPEKQYRITAAGTTGSARKLVESAVGAAIVKNKIKAYAVGTTTFHPDVRTIVEITKRD